ncbi:MAG: SDR family oxidoreductase [Bdellovibrionaceae bacterium]|nr:SDR family oxidoreductase [Bdellovibrionales bacterium]MCB9086353.1 SDR family oxidoreductase [Pseudobdellovibrionaceae bacterium]
MKGWTLVTGASGGIGLDMAEMFAEKGHNLILVARSEDKLKALAGTLKEKYKIEAEVIPCDLGVPRGAEALYKATQDKGFKVQVLVNNAGFGEMAPFAKMSAGRVKQMVQLNIATLVDLCHLYLQGMEEFEKGAGILNVASTAAFQPGPEMSLYYATKAFVLSFSEGLHEEMKPKGIHVSALCPGPTRTQFMAEAGIEDGAMFKLPIVLDSKPVARAGVNGFLRNKAIVVPGFGNRSLIFSLRLTPRSWVRCMVKSLHKTAVKSAEQ